MSESYIVYLRDCKTFLKIRNLNTVEITKLVEEIKAYIAGSPNPGVTFKEYQKLLFEALIDGKYKKAVQSKINKDILTFEVVYQGIIAIYKFLAVENVCNLVNDEIDAVDGERSHFSEMLSSIKGEDSEIMKNIADTSSIELIRSKLNEQIIGQGQAIDQLTNNLKLIGSKLETRTTMMFIGPTGVGKTELAKVFTKEYLGSMDKLIKINCGEYSSKHEYSKLIGSPPGYIGHDKKGLLSEKAEESSRWVILFDEIEKADDKLYDLLLALLDDGTLVDSQGVELDFKDSICIFTSNIGMQDNVGKLEMGFTEDGTTRVRAYKDAKQNVDIEFKNRFKPEFINRIDSVIHFNQLTKEDATKIVELQLNILPVRVTKKLISYIVENAFSEEYGARNIKRYIKTTLSMKLADKILGLSSDERKDSNKGKYSVTVKGGEIVVL